MSDHNTTDSMPINPHERAKRLFAKAEQLGMLGPNEDMVAQTILDAECDAQDAGAAYTYRNMRREIDDTKARAIRKVVNRAARQMHTCRECGKTITRHAAMTDDGWWHHLGCIASAPSPEYHGTPEAHMARMNHKAQGEPS